MNKHELMARTKQFAVRVFKLMDRLPRSEAAKVVTYQLLKSASSVAANYRAANRGKSDADFTNKIKTVLEEADESHFWLTFLADVDLINASDDQLVLLINEANELTAIFTASLKTLNQRRAKI